MLVKAFGETWPIMKLAIHADIEVKAVAFARMAVFMISTGLLIRRSLGISVKDSLDPGKRTDTGGKEDVIDVNAGNESDTLRPGSSALFEGFRTHCGSNEHTASDNVPADQGDPSTDFIEEEYTADLADNSHRVIDTVDQEGAILEADSGIDVSGVILDGRDTSHLDRKLQDDTVENLSKIGLVLEDLGALAYNTIWSMRTHKTPSAIH
jgi:hypothetical protein